MSKNKEPTLERNKKSSDLFPNVLKTSTPKNINFLDKGFFCVSCLK
jgi:hypothetical protein